MKIHAGESGHVLDGRLVLQVEFLKKILGVISTIHRVFCLLSLLTKLTVDAIWQHDLVKCYDISQVFQFFERLVYFFNVLS